MGLPAQDPFGSEPQEPPKPQADEGSQVYDEGSQAKKEFTANDPENSPEMKIAWDEWHKRVAGAIFAKYARLVNAAFYRSKPLSAVAAYTVTRNGRIMNARLTQPNVNPIYNAICLTAINSVDGNLEILRFPSESRRMTVDKASTFIQNNNKLPIGDFGPDTHPPLNQTKSDTTTNIVKELMSQPEGKLKVKGEVIVRALGHMIYSKGVFKGREEISPEWVAGLQQKIQRSWDSLGTADTRRRLGDKLHKVVMIFQIDASGEPFKMRLDHSTGNADLDQSAILAVRKAAPYLAPPTVPEHLQATFNISLPQSPQRGDE